jgi:hypothetical protein
VSEADPRLRDATTAGMPATWTPMSLPSSQDRSKQRRTCAGRRPSGEPDPETTDPGVGATCLFRDGKARCSVPPRTADRDAKEPLPLLVWAGRVG